MNIGPMARAEIDAQGQFSPPVARLARARSNGRSRRVENDTEVAVDRLMPTQKVLVAVFLIVAAHYLSWRAGTLNPAAPVFSGLLYGVEWALFLGLLTRAAVAWHLTVRLPPTPLPGLDVDVFVVAGSEPTEVVRRALLAVRNMDYPHTAWLLDDGDRPELARLAVEFGVHYLARETPDQGKAGCLNNALRQASGEFVAVFNADHAPKRGFLSETLGFLRDSATAFVQTPQDFYNLDSYQHRDTGGGPVWTERSLFFRVGQRGRDRWNCAQYCGSCAVLRRSALDAIGGFQSSASSGDLETSIALHQAGFRSVYSPEPLAFGVAPEAARSFLSQRVRAGQEAMLALRRHRLFLTGRLTAAQRLCYLEATLGYFDGWLRAVLYLAPVWMLMTGSLPISAGMGEFLPIFLPYLALAVLVSAELGRGYGSALLSQHYRMARFAAFIWASLTLVWRGLATRPLPLDDTGVGDQPGSNLDGNSDAGVESLTMAPQAAISFINLFAVLFAMLAWPALGHLPGPALAAAAVWACGNALLAFAVVRFSLTRVGWRRQDYRFPIALPARARVGANEPSLLTVKDISSSGCRLAGHCPRSVAVGDGVIGTLELPDGPLRFRARVVALIPERDERASHRSGERNTERSSDGRRGTGRASHSPMLGVCFEGIDRGFRDRLDLYLYGSDLQWQLRGLSERGRTPTETLFRENIDLDERRQALSSWTSAELLADPNLPPILISEPIDPEARRVVASYRRLDGAPSLRLLRHDRRGEDLIDLKPTALVGRVNTPTGDIYLTEMEPC